MLSRLRVSAQRARREIAAVAAAAHDPRTPFMVRLLGIAVVAYALSPIDLIPDFIPVLGLVDDVILLPLRFLLVVRLLPATVLEEHRRLIDQARELPQSRAAAAVIVSIWLAVFLVVAFWLLSDVAGWPEAATTVSTR